MIDLIAQNYVSYSLKITGDIRTELDKLALQSKTRPVVFFFNEFKSNRIMFDEAGINWTQTYDSSTCARFLPEITTELCD